MRSFIIVLLMIAGFYAITAPPLMAGQLPTRGYISVTNAAVYPVTVGSYQNGELVTVKIWNCIPTNAVLTVSQVYKLGSTTVTSVVTTVTGNLSGNGSADLSAKYLIPSDLLLFKFSGATTGIVEHIRRVGN